MPTKAGSQAKKPYASPRVVVYGNLRTVRMGAFQKFGGDNGKFPWIFTKKS